MPDLSWLPSGTNGAAITAANSGLDSVSLGSGATAVYDNAHVLFGTVSAKLTTSTVVQAEPAWSTQLGTITTGYARFYLYYTATPLTADRLCMGFCQASNVGFGFDMTVLGKLTTKVASSATFGTTANALPTGQWIRIEMDVPAFSTTAAAPVLRYYNSPHSATPTETISGTARNVNANATFFRLPIRAASYGPFWIDGAEVSTTAQPGPLPPPGSGPGNNGDFFPFMGHHDEKLLRRRHARRASGLWAPSDPPLAVARAA